MLPRLLEFHHRKIKETGPSSVSQARLPAEAGDHVTPRALNIRGSCDQRPEAMARGALLCTLEVQSILWERVG